ncbi:unnamed protein product [Dicrocoelium dendriticum]|nr:unnamed protein product [Dicrocoelium dendriticum]
MTKPLRTNCSTRRVTQHPHSGYSPAYSLVFSCSRQSDDDFNRWNCGNRESDKTQSQRFTESAHQVSDVAREKHNVPDNKQPTNQSLSFRFRDFPVTRESQGSSSTSSGATAMSMSTGTGGSANSCQSMRNRYKTSNTRGARCNSSASSSTEETEARERGFGSVDLHPLPTVAPPAAGIRRTFISPAVTTHPNQVDFSALLALQQQCMKRLITIQTSSTQSTSSSLAKMSPEPAAPHSLVEIKHGAVELITEKRETPVDLQAVSTELSPAELSTLSQTRIASHPLSTLPSSLWPCLVCPVHSRLFLQSCGFLHDASNEGPYFPLHPLPDSAVQRHPSEAERHPTGSLPTNSVGFPNASSSVTLPWLGPAVAPSSNSPRVGPYEVGPTLGRGNFAVVKLARHVQTKVKVAIKIINKELIGSSNLSKVFRELEAMKRCQHPHIVRLYHVMESECSIFMVTEFASEGEVFDHISKSRAFSEKEARELFWQIVCAVDFCHSSGVVHRDLKAENLLLDSESKIKVADFGFCNFFRPGDLLSTHCGSPQYAAPELFKGEPYDGPLADVWSLGVILYILVCGSFPFPGESLGDIRSQVLRGLVRFPFFLSTACEQVIRCMLAVDPARRFSLQQITNTPWMQASPNVSHYYAMIEKYRNKAKDKKFDEIFRSQYPEHSELVHKGEADRTERRLKTNLIRALAVGAGFDEVLVRSSTIQAKYDRFHAAYQLLCAKLLHFKRSQQLRQFVEEVFLFKTGDHGEQHHRGLVHTVSNMLMVSSQPLSEQLEDISFYSDIWKSTAEPNELELKLALFILRADEDAILSHLGVQTSHWVNSVAPGVRRHTVQLPTSPLTFPRLTPTTLTGATTEPNVERGVKSPIPTGVAPVQNPVNATDTVGNTAPRTVPHQFSRQYTQPPLIGSLLVSGQFRTGLQWTTNLSSSGAKGLSFPNSSDGTEEITDNRTSKRPINLPSLELGQEAATTKPPSHVLRFRSNFRRHDPVQESTIEEPIDSVPIVAEDTLASVASQASCLTGVSNSYNLPDIPFHPLIPQLLPDACLMYMSSWDHTIRDGACLGALSGSNPEHGNLPASMDTAAMETETTDCPSQPLNPLSCWPNSSIGPDDDNGATSDAHGLGVLLPQLNLPANLPAVIHQPVARFTVKDPHLLAPPGFMIPHCSSFPRRSSDGAADLQPLHRPVLTVGGSYPEQANYRSKPSASEKDADALSGSVIVQPASDVDTPHLSTATQASECASHTATKAPRDPLIRSTTARSFDTSSYPNKHPRHVLRFSHSLGFKLRGSSAVSYRIPTGVLAAQHRTLCTALRATRTCTSTTRSWWRPPGRRWTADQSDGDSESFVAGPNSLDADPQVSRYQKRFSLPNTSRFIPSFVSHDANATSRLAECICHFPLGPDAINQIQNILSQLSVCYSAYSEHFQSPHVVINEVMWAVEGKTVGHGSENSQLLTWKRRSDQHSHSTSPNSTHGTGSIGDRMAESTSDTTNLERFLRYCDKLEIDLVRNS